MENLALHIEYLLLRHDCVILPGIGAFINVRHSAYFDSHRGEWYPMTREVRFNGALKYDDGLLANSFARKNKLNFQEGRELLRKELNILTNKINFDGEITLGNLGILKGEEETLEFKPYKLPSKVMEMYGFTNVPNSIKAEKENEIEEPRLEFTVKKKDTEKNYYIAINKTFARIAASLTIIFVVALSIILPTFNKIPTDKASVLPVDKIVNVAKDKSTNPTSLIDDNAVSSLDPPVKDSQITRDDKLAEDPYHIVVATFNSAKEAQKFKEEYTIENIDLEVITTPTKSRVSAASSSDKSELQKIMASPEFRERFKEAWIWEKP